MNIKRRPLSGQSNVIRLLVAIVLFHPKVSAFRRLYMGFIKPLNQLNQPSGEFSSKGATIDRSRYI